MTDVPSWMGGRVVEGTGLEMRVLLFFRVLQFLPVTINL
jgi:hypothetical protein